MSRPRVLVVGGGVVGVSCAYAIAKAGAQVQLLERDHIGSGASGGNGGTVAVGHPPLNRRGRLREALRSLLDERSPLYIPPRWDPRLWGWLREFMHYSTVRAKIGRCVIWPVGYTHVHRGVTPNKDVKYIITGWASFKDYTK